ncbi:MAG TPA: plastocyanin/azurin family copper-binding protein [Gemmatimonadaceae bacterium]
MHRLATWIAVLTVPCALACGGGSSGGGITPPPPPPPPNPNRITVGNDHYTPATDTVAVGSQVVWSWDTCSSDTYGGQTCQDHSVTFDDGPTSPTQSTGSFDRTFSAAGSYTYYCKVHGRAVMSGTIVVH